MSPAYPIRQTCCSFHRCLEVVMAKNNAYKEEMAANLPTQKSVLFRAINSFKKR
jgi:hypothetical protein